MPSDMREAVIAAWMDQRRGPKLRTDEATADAALAVIRERLAEAIRERSDQGPTCRGWNLCRAAMLRELGGEG